MEERIKTIKVTKENLVTVAWFTRGDYEVKDISKKDYSYSTKEMTGFLKWETVEKIDTSWVYTDPRTGKEYLAFLDKSKNDDVYDVSIIFSGYNSGYSSYTSGKPSRRFLTPVRVNSDETLESVNKITINVQVGNDIVKHRLYFTKEEESMWDRNMDALANLLNGSVDTIWIEYTV